MAATDHDAVREMIAPTLEAMGYSLVRVRLMESRPRCLQVMADRHDGVEMTVEDCATLSTAISAVLDVEDPIKGQYDLEVSSPGIDRPLVTLDDFERYVGFEAKLETDPSDAGRKRYRGRLAGVDNAIDDAIDNAIDNAMVRIDIGPPEGTVAIPFAGIREAKLVLTDELIAASRNRAEMNSESGE